MSRAQHVIPDSKTTAGVPMPCRHHSAFINRYDGDQFRYCDVCHATYRAEVRESSWQKQWLIQFHHVPSAVPVQPVEAPSSVDPAFPPSARVPVTARQGSRQAGATPAAHHEKGAA